MLLESLWSFQINPEAPSCLEMWKRFRLLGTPWRRCRAKTIASSVPAGAWNSRGRKATWKGAWGICSIVFVDYLLTARNRMNMGNSEIILDLWAEREVLHRQGLGRVHSEKTLTRSPRTAARQNTRVTMVQLHQKLVELAGHCLTKWLFTCRFTAAHGFSMFFDF